MFSVGLLICLTYHILQPSYACCNLLSLLCQPCQMPVLNRYQTTLLLLYQLWLHHQSARPHKACLTGWTPKSPISPAYSLGSRISGEGWGMPVKLRHWLHGYRKSIYFSMFLRDYNDVLFSRCAYRFH